MITYFAQLDENNRVLVVNAVTQEFINENPERYPGTWIQTFTDDPNKTYAGIGYTYDPVTQNFNAPATNPEPE
jgi:hypothetical protein